MQLTLHRSSVQPNPVTSANVKQLPGGACELSKNWNGSVHLSSSQGSSQFPDPEGPDPARPDAVEAVEGCSAFSWA